MQQMTYETVSDSYGETNEHTMPYGVGIDFIDGGQLSLSTQ